MANTTYDNILQEGKKIGLEQGKRITISNLLKTMPDLSNEQIANIGEVPITFVEQIRKSLDKL